MRPVGHQEEISLVDHLDELRWRIVASLIALTVAFALCFWQSGLILDLAAEPLPPGDRALIVLAPAELPVGVITAFLGAPFFLWLLVRRAPGGAKA